MLIRVIDPIGRTVAEGYASDDILRKALDDRTYVSIQCGVTEGNRELFTYRVDITPA